MSHATRSHRAPGASCACADCSKLIALMHLAASASRRDTATIELIARCLSGEEKLWTVQQAVLELRDVALRARVLEALLPLPTRRA